MLANTRILLLLSIATFCGFDVAQGQSDIKKTGIQGYGKELSNQEFIIFPQYIILLHIYVT